DRVEAEDQQGLVDRADRLGVAVEARVHRAQELGAQRRVFGDEAAELPDVEVFALGELQDLDGDGGERGEGGAFADAFEKRFVHERPGSLEAAMASRDVSAGGVDYLRSDGW